MQTTDHDESNLVKHAKRELSLLGLNGNPDEVDKLGREGVLELVCMFSQQGHSGNSAMWMIGTLERLLRFEPLTQLTDDPDEWQHIDEGMAGRPDLWQSRRQSRAFSRDGGKTYYLVDELADGDFDLEVTPLYQTTPKDQLK